MEWSVFPAPSFANIPFGSLMKGLTLCNGSELIDEDMPTLENLMSGQEDTGVVRGIGILSSVEPKDECTITQYTLTPSPMPRMGGCPPRASHNTNACSNFACTICISCKERKRTT